MIFPACQLQDSKHSTEFLYYCDLMSVNNLACGSMKNTITQLVNQIIGIMLTMIVR